MTTTSLAALETLTSPPGEAALQMPGYVAVLASDVVNGNPANAEYQGQPLGNLADQTSDAARATALTDLIGKWFEGSDMPAVEAGATYSVVAGPLYGDDSLPSSADDYQGQVGDCYLISALGAIADSSPQAIENMVIPDGVVNGIPTYTVRFFYQNATGACVPDYVTVNGLLPATGGSVVYAGPGADGSGGSRSWKRHTPSGTNRARRAATARTPTPPSPAAICSRLTSRSSAAPRRLSTRRPATCGGADRHRRPPGRRGGDGGDLHGRQRGAFRSTFFGERPRLRDRKLQPVKPDLPAEEPLGGDDPSPLTWAELCEFSPWMAVAGTQASRFGQRLPRWRRRQHHRRAPLASRQVPRWASPRQFTRRPYRLLWAGRARRMRRRWRFWRTREPGMPQDSTPASHIGAFDSVLADYGRIAS